MTTYRPRHRLPRGGNRCDFCGGQDIHSLHSCSNFDWEGKPVFQQDTGRWAACWMCSGYIEKERRGQLTRRTLWQVSKRQGISANELKILRESLKELHTLFASHVVQGEALKIHEPHVRRVFLDASV